MNFYQLCEEFPHLTKDDIRYATQRFNTIKGRCGRVKGYEDVTFNIPIKFFIQWLNIYNFFERIKTESLDVCRYQDLGNYDIDNIYLTTAKLNRQAKNLWMISDHNGVNTYVESLSDWHKQNKEKLSLPYVEKLYASAKNNDLVLAGKTIFKIIRLRG